MVNRLIGTAVERGRKGVSGGKEATGRRKRKLGKALSWLLGTTVMGMLVFAMASNFIIIVQATISPLSVVKGNSMFPYIKDGDAVLLTGLAPEDVRVGDVVVFPDPQEPEQSVVHRVIEIDEQSDSPRAVTKGDANPSVDPFTVPLSRVIGEVKMVIPRGGVFIDYLRSPSGYVNCVILPLLVLALYLLARWYIEKPAPRKGVFAHELIPQE